MKTVNPFLFFLVLYLHPIWTFAQGIDTLRLNCIEAEEIFLKNNLSLIAERLTIAQGDALIQQAKAWPNPNLSIDEVNINRNETSEEIPPLFGSFGRNQQFTLQLEQLILTAQKRKKNIAMEMDSKAHAENTLFDILLSLKAEFRTMVAELVYLQNIKKDLLIEKSLIDKLLKAQQIQLQSGDISQATYLRIKTLRTALLKEINDKNEELNALESHLKTLMAVAPSQHIVITDQLNETEIRKLEILELNQLYLLAENSNPSLKVAGSSLKLSHSLLTLEKAKRVPDLTFNVNYDRQGSTMFSFFGAGISMDIPLFDSNKGNISYAQLEIAKNERLLQETKLKIGNGIHEAFQNLRQSLELFHQFDKDFLQELDKMQAVTGSNFLSRNISLLEFLDFFESFKESKISYYQILRDIKQKKNELSYLIGIEL
ncbi:TolC family protein [Olivibacter sp. SDN3]|uniref:TolC family protein n=1 Tax=Olivibacter sp. SDN3 TaxID=2764720 RepID=UPI0016513072|nr:TolC family protein [Olivibacter sp. SDN3]QNL49485.1 TolC family protein [Olivibacter sp. SDN3]